MTSQLNIKFVCLTGACALIAAECHQCGTPQVLRPNKKIKKPKWAKTPKRAESRSISWSSGCPNVWLRASQCLPLELCQAFETF